MKSDVKYEKACRCCLAEHGHMKNLLEDTFQVTNGESVKLLEGFTKCSGIDSEPVQTFTNVCNSCETKLVISYEFRELCQTSNRILEDHLPEVKQEHYSDEEPLARKKTPKKRPGRPKKVSDEPEIVYMKEEPFEEPLVEPATTPLAEETIKEEVVTVESNSVKGNDTNDEDESVGGAELPAHDDRNYDDDDDDEEDYGINYDENEGSMDVDAQKKEQASYQCFNCDKNYRTYTMLCRHRNAEHPVEQRLIKRTCPLCHIKTHHYTKHLKQQHKDFRPNRCLICPASFISHVKLQDHMRVHRPEKQLPFKCMSSDCGRFFGTSHRYRHHIKYDKHSGSGKYHCPRCGLDFAEFQPLHTHFKAEHDVQNMRNLFPCYKCKEIYKFRRFILEHKCEVKPKKAKKNEAKTGNLQGQNFKCPQCAEEFENEDALVCHRYSICLDDPKFICMTCGKECINQKRLTTHKRTHKDMTYICEECGFQAIDRHTLTKHRTTHSEERTAKCDICGAAFKNIYKLNTHKQIHDIRKYECAICAHKFKTLSSLKRHIIATHLRPPTTFKLECKFCGKKYARSRDLAGHIRNHTGELVKCQICEKSFKSPTTLQHHILLVHEGLTFKCVYCNLTFNSKSGLKQHLFIHRGFMPFNCTYCTQKFVRKYRFVKHLTTHNVEYNEAIHGYQETDDINAIIGGSLVAPARVGTSDIEKEEGFSLNYQNLM